MSGCEWCGGSAYAAPTRTAQLAYRCRACGALPPMVQDVPLNERAS